MYIQYNFILKFIISRYLEMIEYTEKIITKENYYLVNPGWKYQIEVRINLLKQGLSTPYLV